MVGQVLEAYRALAAGREPPVREHRPFRDFVAWLAAQDGAGAREWWARYLAGVTAATVLGTERATGRAGRGEVALPVPAAVTTALAGFARARRLTLNTVVQGAWALLLGRYGGSGDVVYGVVSSGRGGQIEGMEDMVGLLMTTTPARVVIPPGQYPAPWLQALQDQQVQARRYEHTPLPDIQAATSVPPGQPLFTTLYVFENYPDTGMGQGQDSLTASGLHARGSYGYQDINYPLVASRRVPGRRSA